MSPRPDYIERRISFDLARQRARREHVQPCDCSYCITTERIDARFRAIIERNRAQETGIDF